MSSEDSFLLSSHFSFFSSLFPSSSSPPSLEHWTFSLSPASLKGCGVFVPPDKGCHSPPFSLLCGPEAGGSCRSANGILSEGLSLRALEGPCSLALPNSPQGLANYHHHCRRCHPLPSTGLLAPGTMDATFPQPAPGLLFSWPALMADTPADPSLLPRPLSSSSPRYLISISLPPYPLSLSLSDSHYQGF